MKLYLLDYGQLTADQGFFFEGAGTSTYSQTEPPVVRKNLAMVGALIEHPQYGLILYEAGPAPNYKELWPEGVFEIFAVTSYTDDNRLDNILQKLGYGIKDIKAVIIGHLHLDHAGGLELFRGTNVPIYVHEEELKYAFYAVATKEDFGAYLPHYLDSQFNWKDVHGNETELFKNMTLYHTPGHTPGLMSLKVELPNSDTFVFTSDLCFFKENFEQEVPLGWLMRDTRSWYSSIRKIKSIVQKTDAKVIFGHDPEVLASFKRAPEFYD